MITYKQLFMDGDGSERVAVFSECSGCGFSIAHSPLFGPLRGRDHRDGDGQVAQDQSAVALLALANLAESQAGEYPTGREGCVLLSG